MKIKYMLLASDDVVALIYESEKYQLLPVFYPVKLSPDDVLQLYERSDVGDMQLVVEKDLLQLIVDILPNRIIP